MPIRFVYQSISWLLRVYRWNYAAYTASRLRREEAASQRGQANGYQDDARQGRLFFYRRTSSQEHHAKNHQGKSHQIKQVTKTTAYWVYDHWEAIGGFIGNIIFPAVVCVATVTYCSISSRQLKAMKRQITEMQTERADNDQSTNAQIKILRSQSETAGKQATALRDAADQAKIAAGTARDAMIAAQRAWVGPAYLTWTQGPTVGTDGKLQLYYQNTGREPATRFFNIPGIPTVMDFGDPSTLQSVDAAVKSFQKSCFEWQATLPGTSVVYPAEPGTNNSFQIPVAKNLIDQPMTDGRKALVVNGCFVYWTAGITHHSSYCFIWGQKMANGAFFNYCQAGNDAD